MPHGGISGKPAFWGCWGKLFAQRGLMRGTGTKLPRRGAEGSCWLLLLIADGWALEKPGAL